MKIQNARRILIRTLEVLALMSLLFTHEINPGFLFSVLGVLTSLGTIEIVRGKELKHFPSWVVFSAFALLFIAAIYVFWKRPFHPLILGAYLAPLAQTINWGSEPTLRNWAWRLGLSFVSLILSIAISPEIEIAILLFFYLSISSLALTCLYLENDLIKHKIDTAPFKLSRVFVQYSLGLSVVIFVLSLLIFPILPRHQFRMGTGWGGVQQGKVGYNETVDLSEMLKLSGSGGGQVVLRVLLPQTTENFEDPRAWFPYGLLKGKSLDQFDGSRWTARTKSKTSRDNLVHLGLTIGQFVKGNKNFWVTEFIGTRELASSLPTPYGTSRIQVPISSLLPIQYPGREWSLPRFQSDRSMPGIQYLVEQSNLTPHLEPPASDHLSIPEPWKGELENLQSLSNRLLRGLKTHQEKVKKIKDYFATGKFKPSTEFEIVDNKSLSDSTRSLLQLSRFLFDNHTGHCQLFSTAAAILLRLGGVPTRLVAGFRVSRPASNFSFSVREGDAHAWIEAWDPAMGWLPMDPTPAQIINSNFFVDTFDQAKEFLATSWYRYVVSYGDQNSNNRFADVAQIAESLNSQNYEREKLFDSLKKWGDKIFGFATMIFTLVLCLVWFSKRAKANPTPSVKYFSKNMHRQLEKRRKRFKKWSQTHKNVQTNATWQNIDEMIRFGKHLPETPEWKNNLSQMDHFLDNIGA